MSVRMKEALRPCLAGLALGGFIAFTSVPTATAQWLRPWPAASPGDIEQRLEAQGYLLVAPLHRRPMVYLADVSAGPAGYQRLVIDAWSGVILQRFAVTPRRWGPVYAMREGGFAEPPPPGATEPLPPGAAELPPGGGFSTRPNDAPAPKSAYGGPPNVHIPAAISPVGPSDAPSAARPRPKSNATSHNRVPGTTTAPPAAAPLPPPAPREATTPDAPPPMTPKAPEPKSESTPTEVQSAPPAPPDEAKQASVAPPTELKPEAPKTEPQPDAQKPPSATAQSARGPSAQPAAPDSSAKSSEKSKVSIVPAAAFE
jgi:hypothetical protein